MGLKTVVSTKKVNKYNKVKKEYTLSWKNSAINWFRLRLGDQHLSVNFLLTVCLKKRGEDPSGDHS